MIRQYFSSVRICTSGFHLDGESSGQHATGQNRITEVPQQPLISHSRLQTPVTSTSIQRIDLRHYSLDGSSEAPGGHRFTPSSRDRRRHSTRNETRSHRPTQRHSSDNESSEQVSPPPQSSRTPAIRPPLRQRSLRWQLSDAIAIASRRLTDGSSSHSPLLPSSDISWEEYISDDTVINYRNIGAQYQAWIAGQNTTACPVRRSRVTWEDLVSHPLQDQSFEVYLNDLRSPPEEAGSIESTGLSTGDDWRYVFLRRYDGVQEGWTVYQHRTGLGAIFVDNITRRIGPYWSQVAQAQYQLDNHIDTLRYVYFLNVQNLFTWPYVEIHLYPRHGLHWFDDPEPQCWTYGTREYQELLGTKLGRGVARLVLGAWPRGTHRIDAIHTWTIIGNLQMRFDIEPI